MTKHGSQNNRSFIYSEEDNETYFTYYSDFNRPWHGAAYIETTIVIILFLWSGFGNALYIAFMIKFEKARTVTNYFVCNLALADILFVIMSPLVASVRITESWRLGLGLCRLFNIGAIICSCVMIWTMVVISIERYLCVAHTNHSRKIRPIHAALICVTIWAITCGAFAPMVMLYHVKEVKMGTSTVAICTLIWPEEGHVGLLVPCVFIILIFMLPVTLISVNYIRILRIYWSAKTALAQANSQMREGKANNSRRKKDLKIVKTLVLLVVLFIVMWTPIFIVFGLITLDKNTDRRELPSAALFWSLILTLANSGVNPFLYGFTSSTLKQYALCCCRRNKVSTTDMTYVSQTAIRQNDQHVTNLSS